MTTQRTIKPKSEFKFWFEPEGADTFGIFLDHKRIGYIEEDGTIHLTASEEDHDAVSADDYCDIANEFEEYRENRPEYLLSVSADYLMTKIDYFDPNECRCLLLGIIEGLYYSKYSDELAAKYMERFADWILKTDFFTAPASTIYHDSEPFGLLKHTLRVLANAVDLLKLRKFRDVSLYDAALVSIVHDFCKIDFYEEYQKNVKNEQTGVWEKQTAYRCKGSAIPLGHGVTSMFMAQKFFKLTTEQALAIRWHMGEHSVAQTEVHDLMDANEKYPLVQLLQTADRLAIS